MDYGLMVQNELSRFKYVTNLPFPILILFRAMILSAFVMVSAQREDVMEATCRRLMVKSQRRVGHSRMLKGPDSLS